MFVAIGRITLSIPKSGSLKSKRQVVHKVVDKIKARFNVSIAEVADLDLWQKATLGIAAIANEHAFAQECVSKVIEFIEELYVAPVVSCSTEVIPLGDELYGSDDGTSFGSAARGAHRTLAEAELNSGEHDFATNPEPLEPSKLGQSFHRGRQKKMSDSERERAIENLRQRYRAARRRKIAQDDSDSDDDEI